jgi:uncharacterized protein YbjT (DUF2867 family)
MRVLVCGGAGFVGKAVVKALQANGHEVVLGVSRARAGGMAQVVVDYAKDTDPSVWLPRLQGIDAVVNAVGVLRTSRSRPIEAVHAATPQALWQACAMAGVRRVVQVSALGVEHATTRYAQTKREADEALWALDQAGQISAVVVRPSVVFGQGGASSALFMALARLPFLVLPKPMVTARVQPVAVGDLADAVAALLGSALTQRGLVTAVGPVPVAMGDWVASLREQLGNAKPTVWALPMPLTQWSARMGDWVPGVPWCSETLAMLGSDNVGDVAGFQSLIGREPVAPDHLVAKAWHDKG